MSHLLKLEKVILNYHTKTGETLALKDISICIDKEEFVAIVGPSGCGKTTILSLISGILKPSSGKILLNDEPVNTKSGKIGYMFQHDQLFPWRTIWQNVKLGLEIQHDKSDSSKEYMYNLLEKYGLIDFKNKYPHELSGGMRQRVALIRTLVLQPNILLLDEPFSALDYQTRQTVVDDVSSIIRAEKKTSVLVTHDIGEAVSMADRVIVLTKRPATVKAEFVIPFSKEGTPSKKKINPQFNLFKDKVWKELNEDEKTA